ncbi:MAG: Mov34/MPN/PAD-1 family protein [Thermoanaerobaculia bacterium]|nr:Mov34/MPN/PAD-1 family protein [Thermoanaerobaculia bacterium]
MNLVFRVAPGQRVIFVEHAVEQMQAFAQCRWWNAEAGGVLLGRHLLDAPDIVVDEVTTPQDTDRRSRFGFFRSKKHESLARERWQAQRSTMAYLGLWHTHPQKDPTPSSIDRADWQHAIAHDTFEGEQLFFPIVGTERIRVWCLSRRGAFRELIEEPKDG